MPDTQLGPRFDDALVYASDLHRSQPRKGGHVPYVSHLLGVTSLVIEEGGTETQAIAALLHDAVEDQGGLPRLEEIRARFGDDVADIVLACTDSTEDPKPPWRVRKEAYVAHLPVARPDALLVSVADKVHNARSILLDLRSDGVGMFDRFTGGREGTLWYYRTLVGTYRGIEGFRSRLIDELDRVVTEIERIAGSS
ncbi:MAG TPA: HD domain-containing protein [Actinomycetota bacterium]